MSSGLGRVIWANPLGDGSVRLVPYVCSLHAQQFGLHMNSTCPATQARRTKRDSVLTGACLPDRQDKVKRNFIFLELLSIGWS